MKTTIGLLAFAFLLAGCGRAPEGRTDLQDLIWTNTLDGHGISVAGTGLILSRAGALPGNKMKIVERQAPHTVALKDIGLTYFNCVNESSKAKYYETSVSLTTSLIAHQLLAHGEEFLSAKNGGRRYYTIKGIGVEKDKWYGPKATANLVTADGKGTGIEILFESLRFTGRDGKNSASCKPERELSDKELTLVIQAVLKASEANLGKQPAALANDLNNLFLGYQESNFTASNDAMVFNVEKLYPQEAYSLVERTFPGMRKSGDTAKFCDNMILFYEGETSTTDVKTDPSKSYKWYKTAYASNYYGYQYVETSNAGIAATLLVKEGNVFNKHPNFKLAFEKKIFEGLPVPDKALIDRLAKFEQVKARIAKAVTDCSGFKK